MKGMDTMKNNIQAYFDAASARLSQVGASQAEQMQAAATAVARGLSQGGLWYIFGTGHSHMLALEAFYRAGGLLSVAPVLEGSLMLHESAIQSSEIERLSEMAAVIVKNQGMGPDDVLLIASNSGRNAVPVEMAMAARELGIFTIAITSMEHTNRVTSRAPSGQRLFEVVDLVIDNGAPYGDALIAVDESLPPMGPVSTVTGAAIMNAIAVQAATILVHENRPVHVWRSANVDAEDERSTDYQRTLELVRRRVRHL